MNRKIYTDEDKKQGIALIAKMGSVPKAAKHTDVPIGTLYTWLRSTSHNFRRRFVSDYSGRNMGGYKKKGKRKSPVGSKNHEIAELKKERDMYRELLAQSGKLHVITDLPEELNILFHWNPSTKCWEAKSGKIKQYELPNTSGSTTKIAKYKLVKE